MSLTRAVMEGGLVRVVRGAYYEGDNPGGLAVHAAALSAVIPPEGAVCRRTAAWLWGLDLLPPDTSQAEWPVEVVVPAGRTPPRHGGVIAHEANLPARDITVLEGVRVTTMERTAVDCLRFLSRTGALAALDQFLGHGVCREALARRLPALAGERGIVQARELLPLGDRRAESPPESWTRLVIVDVFEMAPDPQHPVPSPWGWDYRLDLAFPHYRTGAEYDGEEHHTSDEDRAHDAERRAWMASLGWRIVVVRREDLGRPQRFLYELRDALEAGGWRSPEGVQDRIARCRVARRPTPRRGRPRRICG